MTTYRSLFKCSIKIHHQHPSPLFANVFQKNYCMALVQLRLMCDTRTNEYRIYTRTENDSALPIETRSKESKRTEPGPECGVSAYLSCRVAEGPPRRDHRSDGMLTVLSSLLF